MKLNLRDLFWLIFVSAVATMWWIDRSKLAGRLEFYESPNFPADPFGPPQADPFGGSQPVPPPLAPAPASADPFGPPSPGLPSADPFGGPSPASPAADPFGPGPATPPGQPPPDDPFG